MDDLLTSYGYGYGSGYGYGYGYGSSYGYGDGYGYGYGDGYGYGYGDGDGYGYGYGDGALFLTKIGCVDGKDICTSPWGLIHIGCQTHSVDFWAENWDQIAKENGVEIGRDEALALIDKARRAING